ncbi:putative fructokinase-4 [Sesbania bispinosa]|nr:putative fructokinase-4 [Sesbania bispinosa]
MHRRRLTLINFVPVTGDYFILNFDEMLINFVPTISNILLRLPASLRPPANIAIVFFKHSGKVAFINKLGDDGFSHMVAAILKEKKPE